MNELHPASWSCAGVVRGPQPTGTTTFAELLWSSRYEEFVHTTGNGLVPRAAHIMVLQHAVEAIFTAVVEPWLVEGATVRIAPSALGIVADRENGGVAATWIGEANASEGRNAPVDTVRELLATVFDSVGRAAPANRSALEKLAARDLEALGGRVFDAGRTTAFIDQLGWRHRVPHRFVTVIADGGPPVAVPIPSPCCVLAHRPGPHACPACPSRSSVDRDAAVRTWLEQMDDESFTLVAGRARVPLSTRGSRDGTW